MKNKPSIQRRDFLKTAVAATVASPALTQSAPAAPIPGLNPGEMKLACVSWNFRGIGEGPPADESIDIIGGMGFDGIELIVSRPEDLEAYWKKDSVISGVKKKLDSHKLAVSQFVFFQSAVENLSSLDSDKRNRSLDVFEEGCKIAVKLNAPIVNMVAPWARELKGPQDYLPRYFAQTKGAPEAKYHIDIAKGFDYDAVWQTFVQTMKDCTERAVRHGLRFSLENHTHTLVHDATAFLKLWDEVRLPALGMNMDIGWIQLQRAYPPYEIHQVKKHLMNVHLRDIDGVGLVFVGIGSGVMDFKAVVETLKEIGFTGYLAFEQDGVPDMHGVIRKGKEMLSELIG
jgi:sugar phosphate isomerase/epimerase